MDRIITKRFGCCDVTATIRKKDFSNQPEFTYEIHRINICGYLYNLDEMNLEEVTEFDNYLYDQGIDFAQMIDEFLAGQEDTKDNDYIEEYITWKDQAMIDSGHSWKDFL